jgi:Mycothiol maleylpyruvate isomerase N-terminal domain
MYFDGLSFLEDERELWRPFEALDGLTDDQLDRPVAGARGWTGRDLIGHLVAWQEVALAVAKELAVSETSPAKERADADWDARGDAINDDLLAHWRAMPLSEVRERLRTVPGELRGYLTVVPESRWIKHSDHLAFLSSETMEHYEEHEPDLRAILAAAEEPASS